jgi:hypothetical protein
LWLIKVWFSASTFVVKIATFAKRQNVTTNARNRQHSKIMTKNVVNILSLLSNWKNFQSDQVWLFGQVKEKKEKAHPSHFLKFLIDSPYCTHLVLPDSQTNPSQNQKSATIIYDRYLNNFSIFDMP